MREHARCQHCGVTLVTLRVAQLLAVAEDSKDAALVAAADQASAALGGQARVTFCWSCGCILQSNAPPTQHTH